MSQIFSTHITTAFVLLYQILIPPSFTLFYHVLPILAKPCSTLYLTPIPHLSPPVMSSPDLHVTPCYTMSWPCHTRSFKLHVHYSYGLKVCRLSSEFREYLVTCFFYHGLQEIKISRPINHYTILKVHYHHSRGATELQTITVQLSVQLLRHVLLSHFLPCL